MRSEQLLWPVGNTRPQDGGSAMVRVWRLITHHTDKDAALFWTKQHQRIAIGWGKTGDIRAHNYNSADEITTAVKREYIGFHNAHVGGNSLWNLYSRMQEGDLVILSAEKPRVLVVEVEGDYSWNGDTRDAPAGGDYWHQRKVRIRRDLNPEDIWKRAGGAARQNVHQALIECELMLAEDDV
jgi:predicted Mrr-cat superfamily restriction endonuclease